MITKINFKNFANLKEVDEENLRIREKELENMRIGVILEVVLRGIYRRLSGRINM